MAKNLRDIYVGVDKASENRTKHDFYPTPPLATYALIATLGKEMPSKIIEPCAGRGHISIELLRNGFDVVSYDLNLYPNTLVDVHSPVDATTLSYQGNGIGIVTNPPYHKDLPRILTEKFVSEYDFVAMFVRLTFFEGMKRNKLFTSCPPSDILMLSDRVNFGTVEGRLAYEQIEKKDQIGGMIAYMWVIWNKNALHQNTRCHWVLLKDMYDKWRINYDKSINIISKKDTYLPQNNDIIRFCN